ncbi:hypothetical protein BgiBS90_035102 [Biomphalaria glabrata]|nr:hypothetical protein BgiBS90_035102 [Biomphalaria glabrata]
MEKIIWIRVFTPCQKCCTKFLYKYRVSCDQCKKAHYCSSICWFEDLDSHKNHCLQASQALDQDSCQKSTDLDGKPNAPEKTCFCCERSCGDDLSCWNCRNVFYCSSVCKQKDNAIHSTYCGKTVSFTYINHIIFNGETFRYLEKKGLTSESRTTPVLLSIVHEMSRASVNYIRPWVIVQIVSPYPQNWQYAILVKDYTGEETHIIFHDDKRTHAAITGCPNLDRHALSMAPLSSCLKPGNFIILMDAWWHIFLDRTTGIRIDNLELVHFVWRD